MARDRLLTFTATTLPLLVLLTTLAAPVAPLKNNAAGKRALTTTRELGPPSRTNATALLTSLSLEGRVAQMLHLHLRDLMKEGDHPAGGHVLDREKLRAWLRKVS